MDVSDRSAPFHSQGASNLYLRALDKLLRDTEDGSVKWTKKRQTMTLPGLAIPPELERTVYVTDTPQGRLLLQGHDESQWLPNVNFPAFVEPTVRGEARLYLSTKDETAVLFPPVRTAAFQPIVDDLLMVVRSQAERPQAEEFARRFLGEE